MRPKNKLLVVLMSLMLIASCAVVAMAQQDAGQFCTEHNNFGVDHDTCVVCQNPSLSAGNVADCICKSIGDAFGFPIDLGAPFGVVENHGQCVVALQPFFQVR
jgi:hypothetical protein